jgi:hypothetical protein
MAYPPLSLHLHPLCKQFILALEECYEENPFGKFFGSCNNIRLQLDRCLHEEVRHVSVFQPQPDKKQARKVEKHTEKFAFFSMNKRGKRIMKKL